VILFRRCRREKTGSGKIGQGCKRVTGRSRSSTESPDLYIYILIIKGGGQLHVLVGGRDTGTSQK